MQLELITGEANERAFFDASAAVLGRDPNFVRVPDSDLRALFDPAKNRLYEKGATSVRYVLRDERGELVGRIAAFVQKTSEPREGGFGFFDCIEDLEAARLLLNAAESFLATQGLRTVIGPTNFGERDRFSGALTKGFLPPLFHENYNPPYYEVLLRALGYEPSQTASTYLVDYDRHLDEAKLRRQHCEARVLRSPHRVECVTYGPNDEDKIVPAFLRVYGAAFKRGESATSLGLDGEQASRAVRAYRDLIVPGLNWFAYVNGEPAGFCLFIPNVNELLRGRSPEEAKGIAFAVHPDFHGQGIGARMALSLDTFMLTSTVYRRLYLTGIAHYSGPMNNLAENFLCGKVERVHTTFRKDL